MPRLTRTVVALSLALASASAAAQDAPSRWTCLSNGRYLDIRMSGDQMTVAYDGQTRTLKRTAVRRGSLFTDGVVGIRFMEGDTRPSRDSKWIEDGQASDFSNCTPASG